MHGTHTVLCMVAILAAAVRGFADIKTTQPYNHTLTLDPDNAYTVFWDYNDTHITFEVHVKTLGYVGFGLSKDGRMLQADIVIGWVKDGCAYFADYHATGNMAPDFDTHQDWFLIQAEEKNNRTMLKFVRELDTCDDQDIPINKQTLRLIYSYQPEDPTSSHHLLYHGSNRGSKGVSLLSSSRPPPEMASDDIKSYDFLNNNYEIPAKGTTYLCTAFQMPDLGQKHQMIQYEPIYTPGNEHFLHYIGVLRCHGDHPHLHMKSVECYWNWPDDWPSCEETFITWAVGAGTFYFPENAGYSVGAPDDSKFFVMQTHYNNPGLNIGVLDNSGVRMKLTTRLRPNDVISFTLGHHVHNLHVIPPYETSFTTQGYCAQSCLEKAFEEANIPEIKVVAVFQHAHLLSAGIRTRHFRNGTEIEPLIDDPYYDFHFQEFRQLVPERTIKKGDSFIVECKYDTSDQSEPTFGGLSTHEEMCLSFLYVYPKTTVRHCRSLPMWDTYPEKGIDLRHKFESMNWLDQTMRADFDQKLAGSQIIHTCGGLYPNGTIFHDHFDSVETPVNNPYVAPETHCGN